MDEDSSKHDADEFYAKTYDVSVSDWPGEIDFYREMSETAKSAGGGVLEVACGTGRVAIRLARTGANVVGIDLSPQMLEVARQNSAHISNVRWIEGDMRSFQLTERFNLALIPGHAFQHLNSPQDQVSCLSCIKSHLRPGGILVVHLDHMSTENMKWLGGLCGDHRGVFKTAEQFPHPQTGRQFRASRAWTYEPATQTAVIQLAWDEMSPDGKILSRIQRGPIRLHCVFRFEMEHLLVRVGFEVENLFGDFFRHELQDDSPSMIWIAKLP
jgi:ubiquinone/menaquinone biosynthesis C-methylase UbiE